MPTIAERNAAYDAVKAQALVLVKQFVPSFFESTAEQKIDDPTMIASILSVSDAALNAAEKVRNTSSNTSKS